jgi:hypothetical protein
MKKNFKGLSLIVALVFLMVSFIPASGVFAGVPTETIYPTLSWERSVEPATFSVSGKGGGWSYSDAVTGTALTIPNSEQPYVVSSHHL